MQDPMDPRAGGDSTDRSGEDSPLRLPAGELPESQRLTAQPPSGPFEDESAGEGPPVDGAAGSEQEEKPAEAALPTWERMEEEGFWYSLFATIKEVLTDPTKTFRRMPYTTNIARPLMFALLLGTIGAIVSICYGQVYQTLLLGFLEKRSPGAYELSLQLLQMTAGESAEGQESTHRVMKVFVAMGLAPLLVVVVLLLWSAVVHVLLLLLGAAKRGYETTFRTLAYVKGATSILALLPFCGEVPIALVWSIVASIIGLTQTHKTTPGRAATAVLFPLLLCCGCLAARVLVSYVRILEAGGLGGL